MTEITPEKVATTPPTPENVAEMLKEGDQAYSWTTLIGCVDNVVEIEVVPCNKYGTDLDPVHFRAVVVEGETVPDLAEAGRLKARLEAAEWYMRLAFDALEHDEARHHLARYFAAAEATQAGGSNDAGSRIMAAVEAAQADQSGGES